MIDAIPEMFALQSYSGIITKLNYPQVGLLILAWFITDLITPLVRRLAFRVGAVDQPSQAHKAHREPVAFLGGLCIFIGVAVSLFSILRFTSLGENMILFAMLFGGTFALIVGGVDDFRPIWAVAKLMVMFGMTALLAHFGVRIELTGIGAVDFMLTLLWIAGVTSAINSMDNMDGAATGVCAIAAFWTFLLSWNWKPYGQPGVSYLAIALLGACMGFLRYNFKPASMYLGNNGAFMLGVLLASMMVMTGWAYGDSVKAVIVPCAILAVPLYDITLATLLRIVNGVVRNPIEAITYCGRDHLSHRLVALGLSQREAVLLQYLFAMVSGVVGSIVWKPSVPQRVYMVIAGVSVAVLIGIGILLNRAPVYEKPQEPPHGPEPLPGPPPSATLNVPAAPSVPVSPTRG